MVRNRQGLFVASADPIGDEVKQQQASARATLYTSFYHAALAQKIPAETILKLLRVHSYDVDFKQRVKAGDSFDMFFDGGNDEGEVGELLYTSMSIDGRPANSSASAPPTTWSTTTTSRATARRSS